MAFSLSLARGLQKCMANKWEDSDTSDYDFTVVVEDTSFKCHRLILSACSGFFRGLFNSNMKEQLESRVYLVEISASTFDTIINALYTGKTGLSDDNLLDVWSATDMLQIAYLTEECQTFAMENISVDNYCGILNQATLLAAQNVIDHSLDFIARHFTNVREQDNFLQLSFDYFYKVIAHDSLATDCEELVVDAVLDWVRYTPPSAHRTSLHSGTLDAKAAKEILLVADISTYSLPITGAQEVKYDDQRDENITQDNEKNDQETGIDDQENGADVLVKENVDQSPAFVIRSENSSISESCESILEPKSHIMMSGGNKTMCNKSSSPQTDAKETNRKQHFLKLISSCRLFLAKPSCLENLLKKHIDLLISTGAYNMVLNALKYSFSVYLRHEAWPEAAVHRASSPYKHVMVFLSGNQFEAYSLDTGSVHEFAKVPEDYSLYNNIIVFDNDLYLSYESIDRNNIFCKMTQQKIWGYVTHLNIDYSQMLLAHGNYVYYVYIEENQFTVKRWSYAHGRRTWMTQTCDVSGYNMIRFQQYIVVFVRTQDVVTAHCFNTETDNVHVCMTSMDANAYIKMSFNKNEDIYVLEENGSLWKVLSTDTTPVDFVFVSKLFDFVCCLRGCVLFRNKLYIFYNWYHGNPNTLPTSLPGICEDIVMIQIESCTQCLPMVLPGSWLAS